MLFFVDVRSPSVFDLDLVALVEAILLSFSLFELLLVFNGEKEKKKMDVRGSWSQILAVSDFWC